MIIYRLVKIWAQITQFFYFRKVTVTHEEEIPEGASVIFAPNHQSAFLDPIVVAINTPRNPWFLTRASVFKGRITKALLKMMHMIPVYRPRDMVDLKTANNSTFDFCQEVLHSGRSILIFPEGNHGMQKRLRTPLKKGAGRIALRAIEALREDPVRDIVVVPVGINYEHPAQMRTDLLLNFGKPISVKEIVQQEDLSEGAALIELNKVLAERLRNTMIHIAPKDRYDELEKAWQEKRTVYSSLTKRFKEDKKLITSLAKADQKEGTVPEINSNSFLKPLLIVLGFPLWVTGIILNLPWIITVKLVMKKMVTDPHFIASVYFVCIMMGLPLFTLITAGVLSIFFGGFWIFVALIPLTGLVAYEYQLRFMKKPTPILTRDLAGDSLPED